MMMCIYAYIVNQLAGLQQIRTHWSLLGPINTSLSHLFVHAAVNQAMHTTTHNMQCNAAVFFLLYEEHGYTRTYVHAGPWMHACQFGPGQGKGAFCSLIPVTRIIIMHVPAPSSIPLVASICMHACMRVLPYVSARAEGGASSGSRTHTAFWHASRREEKKKLLIISEDGTEELDNLSGRPMQLFLCCWSCMRLLACCQLWWVDHPCVCQRTEKKRSNKTS